MKKYVAAATMCLGLMASACGGHAKVTPQERQDVTKLQAQLAQCAERDHTLKSLKACVVPPGHSQAFTVCAAKALSGVLLPGGKARAAQKLAVCAENDR